jgi:translation elongation factor EF-Tu-like GTPase
MSFDYAIVDGLVIADRCIVFFGRVGSGAVHVGDDLLLQSPQGTIDVKVMSLEPGGFRRAGARTGDNVAVVVEYVDLAPVADGGRVAEGNRVEVQSLVLRSLAPGHAIDDEHSSTRRTGQ